jgi:hypothetical protein
MDLLKWVGLVFAAGFIGYFGKSLAKKILKGKSKETTPQPSDSQLADEKNQYKLEKKRLKQHQKAEKKAKK